MINIAGVRITNGQVTLQQVSGLKNSEVEGGKLEAACLGIASIFHPGTKRYRGEPH